MATFINVTQGGDELSDAAKAQQGAARLAHNEKQRQQKLAAEKAKQAAQQQLTQQSRSLDPREIRNDLAATRHPSGFGLLFNCGYVDAPSSTWSDGATYAPGQQRSSYQTALALTSAGESPVGAEQQNITLPTVVSSFWTTFDARAPISGGVLDRRYITFTGTENSAPVMTYGYAGVKLKVSGNSVTPASTTPLQPKFQQAYTDSGGVSRPPFHCYASIKSATVINIETGGIIEISNDIVFAVGESFRLAPTPYAINSISILDTVISYITRNYQVTGIAATSATTTSYTTDTSINTSGAAYINLSAYRPYPSWSSVPQSDVIWFPASGAPESTSPVTVADETDYYGLPDASQGSRGTANTFLYTERRKLNLNQTELARGSGLSIKYADDDAFTEAADNQYSLRVGSYKLSSNTDTELLKTPLGPLVDGSEIAPTSSYQAKDGPWSIGYTVSDYANDEYIVFLQQGTYPDETLHRLTFTFDQLAPLLTSDYGNYFFGTLENRFSNPPGTYQYLHVSVVQ